MCCCLQICNSVLNVEVMGLVLGQSWMVISNTGVLLYANMSPLYNVLWEWLCCLQVNYTVYKHFNRPLHIGSLDPTCVQNFRPVPLTILGFKLKIENNDKNWRNRLLLHLPCL